MPEQASCLQVSDHAERRWLERSEAPCMAVLNAWGAATPIYGHGLEGDEVRYHELSETVLVRKNTQLVTVIHAPTAKLTVRRAVHHFGGRSE
ncbi:MULTISPECIES: hypothetical protein [Halorussus]|uniref:hypothetical protein n=1 Tax=Halorussus TaxID=1070314 RepID=UPI0013B3DF71|nr:MULTISPECIES: hypothetical protein [Halorussus]NHN59830.1 hypothetical protein [Halorussus sp. JP-T4]